MPKITEQQRELRRRQILEAAWACFYRRGVAATTMDDIIREAGLSAGAMYIYFASKEELILSAITTSLGELEGVLNPLLESGLHLSADALLMEVLDRLVIFSKRGSFHFFRVAVHGWSEAQRNESLRELMLQFYETFRLRLAEMLVPRANSQEQAQLLLSIILGFIVQMSLIEDVDIDIETHVKGLKAFRGW